MPVDGSISATASVPVEVINLKLASERIQRNGTRHILANWGRTSFVLLPSEKSIIMIGSPLSSHHLKQLQAFHAAAPTLPTWAMFWVPTSVSIGQILGRRSSPSSCHFVKSWAGPQLAATLLHLCILDISKNN